MAQDRTAVPAGRALGVLLGFVVVDGVIAIALAVIGLWHWYADSLDPCVPSDRVCPPGSARWFVGAAILASLSVAGFVAHRLRSREQLSGSA